MAGARVLAEGRGGTEEGVRLRLELGRDDWLEDLAMDTDDVNSCSISDWEWECTLLGLA